MKETFAELHSIALRDREKSPFSKEQTLRDRLEFLNGEVKEVLGALENCDTQNLKEEVGDIFWSVLGLLAIAEEKNLFTTKDVLVNVTEKIKYRKPWIFTGEQLNKEEEIRRWKEAKQK